MLVRDVLKLKPRRLLLGRPDTTVREAVGLLVEHDIGSLPVVDDEGRPVGIFTERDVLAGVSRFCDAFGGYLLGEVMTREPVCCGPDDEIHEVMGRIAEHRIGQLPVVDGAGRVCAVVSLGDLIKALYEHAEAERGMLLAYIYGPVA
jgi:CBS domain-containing protein